MTNIETLKFIQESIDDLTSQNKVETAVMNHDLNVAKEIAHTRKIQINRRNKKIQQLKSLLTDQDKQTLLEQEKLEADYKFKSYSELAEAMTENEIANEVGMRSA